MLMHARHHTIAPGRRRPSSDAVHRDQ